MHFSGEMAPYPIGGGPRPGKHWAHRWHVDFWFRSWQSEAPSLCRFARRSWTAKGALRKMERDYNAALAGRVTFHQWRRTRGARKWDREHLDPAGSTEGDANE